MEETMRNLEGGIRNFEWQREQAIESIDSDARWMERTLKDEPSRIDVELLASLVASIRRKQAEIQHLNDKIGLCSRIQLDLEGSEE